MINGKKQLLKKKRKYNYQNKCKEKKGSAGESGNILLFYLNNALAIGLPNQKNQPKQEDAVSDGGGNGQAHGEPKNNAEDWGGNNGGPDAEQRSYVKKRNRTNIYWLSMEVKTLFGFADYPGVDVVAGLEERINLLKKLNSYGNGYKLVSPMTAEKGDN